LLTASISRGWLDAERPVRAKRLLLRGLATRSTVKLHCFDDPKAPRIELMYLRTRGRELSTQDQVDHAALRWARNWNLAMRCSDRGLINPDELNAILCGN
jgi:hypothetical protein